jgi:hypothetical protein
MKFDGRHFRFELLMEAPLWLLALILVAVTLTVVATGIGVF